MHNLNISSCWTHNSRVRIISFYLLLCSRLVFLYKVAVNNCHSLKSFETKVCSCGLAFYFVHFLYVDSWALTTIAQYRKYLECFVKFRLWPCWCAIRWIYYCAHTMLFYCGPDIVFLVGWTQVNTVDMVHVFKELVEKDKQTNAWLQVVVSALTEIMRTEW